MTRVETIKIEKSSAVTSLRKEQAHEQAKSPQERDQDLERALKDTFPASDPVSVTNPTTSGEPTKKAG